MRFILERLITEQLLAWKNNKYRKPLILKGARQVGKTYSVLEFGKKYFDGALHVIDLEKQPGLHQIFEKDLEPKRILSELEVFLDKEIILGKDLLFIDEIQNCKKALSALRYFFEEIPKLHIIAAGSLIEFVLNDISFPVGRVQIMTMYPMNFYEYLNGLGKEISTENIISKPGVLSEVGHNKLLAELKNYFFVGGMPEAVKVYKDSEKLRTAFEVQKDILATFRQDFSKYAGRSDKKCIEDVFFSTTKNVGNQIKYTKLSEGYSIPTIKKSFELLLDAKIIIKVRSASPAGLPLGSSASNKKFKVIFLDIGLMQQACGLQGIDEYSKENLLSIYRGALAEQFVGQELLSSGQHELFYWSRQSKSSNAEIDYLFANHGHILPVEVKSGPAGKLKSLHILLKTFKNIKNGYVLSTQKYSEIPEQKIIFLPLYYAYAMGKENN